MLYKTEAIVLKKINLGEIDRLITVYSKDLGKILAKAKSVRKNQAKLKGHLEPFTLVYLMLAPGKEIDVVTGVETLENFSNLKQDLLSLAGAYYLADLVNNLIAGPEKDERIWRLLIESFSDLDQKSKPVLSLVRDFEKNFVGFLGYGREHKDPSFFVDSLIGRRLESKLFLQKMLRMVK